MSYAIGSAGAAAPTGLLRFAAGARRAVRAFLHEFDGLRAYIAARSEFNRLDASTMRDLGISRSEFDSFWAETHGQAEQTRVRVIQRCCGRYGP